MEKVSTKKCRSCQADIPVGAKVCQHCKAKQGNWFARHWILTTLLVLFILGAIGSGGTPTATPTADAPKPEVQKVEEPKNKPTINMEEFIAIQNGMTYDKVVEIVGGPGELSSESQFGNIKTSLYTFKGDSIMGGANVTVQNGKVSMKAQFGL